MANVEGLQEFAVGGLIDAVSFALGQPVYPMIAPVMMFGHDEAIEIARVAIVHFCFIYGLVAVLDQIVDFGEVALIGIISEMIGYISLGLHGLHSKFAACNQTYSSWILRMKGINLQMCLNSRSDLIFAEAKQLEGCLVGITS